MQQPAYMDPGQMSIDADGVKGFYWPIPRTDIFGARDAFTTTMAGFLRNSQAQPQAQIITLLLPHLIGEFLSQYRAHALIRRSRRDGRELVFSTHSLLSQAIWNSQLPPSSPVPQQLRQGFPAAAGWRKLARRLRDAISRRNIPWHSLTPNHVATGIVTIALGPTIDRHASGISENVSFIRPEEWFPPLAAADKPRFPALDAIWIDRLSQAVANGFAAGSEPVPDVAQSYLQTWLSTGAIEADRHINRLLSWPDLLPRQLWRGTGGSLWGRLLSHACRLNGGHVTGHDHALGIALFRTTHDSLIEHIACDRFMMWSETQTELGRRNIDERFLPAPAPELAALPAAGVPTSLSSAPPLPARPTRRILYVGTLYSDDRMVYTPLHASQVMIDWEARMLAQLRAWGYEVDVKPHPELPFVPSAGFAALGGKVVSGRAEDLFADYDLLLFSEGLSTPFFNAVQRNHPFVVADVGLHVWQPETLAALKRRCGFVSSHIDSQNRIVMDWDALRHAIEIAPGLKDPTFMQELIGC